MGGSPKGKEGNPNIHKIKKASSALAFVQAALANPCVHMSGPLGPNLSQKGNRPKACLMLGLHLRILMITNLGSP